MEGMAHGQRPLTIFFSAGEPSGDLHGANLIRALRQAQPDLRAVGYGGPKMAEAGCQLHADLTALAVMWFSRVLLNLHKFIALLWAAERAFRNDRPDAVVLIDYPGFNWWMARKAKKHGIPVFYYAPPQIWAWASWRIKKMRRYVDHVLCALPFEADWYRQRGCRATFVGHPYFDEVRQHPVDAGFIAERRHLPGPLVVILPGSRTQEVTHNLRWLLRAAEIIRAAVPGVRFAVAGFKLPQAEFARQLVAGTDLDVEVCVGRTPELIRLADCCLAVSGSVSLELLYHTKPTVVLYWIPRYAYLVQSFFRRVKYITLVNLLSTGKLYAGDNAPYDPDQPDAELVLFPEYLTCEDKSRQIAAHAVEWLTDESRRSDRVAQLAELKARVCHGGASVRAADLILNSLDKLPRRVPRPHFLPGAPTPTE
jgi:lipid-A-disaccharide synthase